MSVTKPSRSLGRESALWARCEGPVLTDRLLAALVHPRQAVTHDVPAYWFGAVRSIITRAVSEVRPLLAERGCPAGPGVRLRTPAEVIDQLGVSGQSGIMDGTGTRARRPAGVHLREE
ncbi:transposase family protein [Streptomyces sp. NPDC056529]|uniref:transposase family protein n=1 Tax=Streptomyces sp. NPDC056529 TaxID=3345855 RepID=UPI003689C651